MDIKICDKCKHIIPLVEKNVYGINIKCYKKGKILYFENVFNNLDLCEKCADEINLELLKSKTEFLYNLSNKGE